MRGARGKDKCLCGSEKPPSPLPPHRPFCFPPVEELAACSVSKSSAQRSKRKGAPGRRHHGEQTAGLLPSEPPSFSPLGLSSNSTSFEGASPPALQQSSLFSSLHLTTSLLFCLLFVSPAKFPQGQCLSCPLLCPRLYLEKYILHTI